MAFNKNDTGHDNVINIGGSEELAAENSRRLTRSSRLKTRLLIVLVTAVVLFGACFYVYKRLRRFRGYKVIHTTDVVFDTNSKFIQFGDNILKYSQDGVSYIDSNGNNVWTAGINTKNPIASQRGNYAVVADKGGNNVYVFNLDGLVSEVTMPYTVVDIDVAKQGAFTCVLESSETNYINMYSSAGQPIYEMQTSINKSGYPIDISISHDGQKLFSSYFYMNGINTNIKLTAYNFGEVGQNANADRMVGGFTFESEMIPKVEFLTNDVVAAFSDKEIIIYDMKEKPTERARIKYDNEIQSIFYSEKYIGTVEKNNTATSTSAAYYTMKLYDLNGKEKFEFPFDLNYKQIYASKDEIIFTGGNQCLIVTTKGRTKFRYSFDSQVMNMIPSSKSDEYIVTFEDKTETIKLTAYDGR
ncbi:MAG: hypothetical protein IIY49_04855 [Eubacterium sp.]|nr:hypothetical protein [Eubacterium sp.]